MSAAKPLRHPAVWALLIVNAALIGALFYMTPRVMMRVRMPEAPARLPVLAEISPFTLTRENGEPFSSSALEGRPWVADFIFTRCPNQCPVMSLQMSLLQKTTPGLRSVSFSVDPAHDTPAVLRAYAARFEADPSRWTFLTGEAAAIGRVQSELKLSNSPDPALHSLRFVLMDAQNRARGYYDHDDPSAIAKLKKGLEKLA